MNARYIPVVLCTLIAAGAGYYLLNSEELFAPSKEDQQVTKQLSDASVPVSEQMKAQAKEHIRQLTSDSAQSTIDVSQADNFVTAEQLLKLPANTQENAKLINPELANEDASASTQAFAIDLPGQKSVQAPEFSLSELPEGSRVSLQELLDTPDETGCRIFYIHSVSLNDKQGLWGILQKGLTQTFAKGLKLHKDGRVLSAQIPTDADERLQDRSSSFLGHVLNQKLNQTLLYNYNQGLMGRNPNLIEPGQQLVIVRFSEEELINIYNYFAHHPEAQRP